MPENPTLAEYDAQHADAEMVAPPRDPRVVALEELVAAEAADERAGIALAQAEARRKIAANELIDARHAYTEAMADTKLR